MNTALITGGTGLVGQALTEALLQQGFQVIILTRDVGNRPAITHENLRFAKWDIRQQIISREAIAEADFIIHLAGAPVADKRWTPRRKQEILQSRTESSKLIVDSLKTIPNHIKTVISASAIGWYGSDRQAPEKNQPIEGFQETDPAANDFLGQTCRQWEAAIEPVSFMEDKRLVKLRLGIVLSNSGGALKIFKKPLSFGIAPIMGSGNQMMSWIHIDDLVRLFLFALDKDTLSDAYNAVAPHPVSNKEFILHLAQKHRGRFFIPVHIPSLVLKMGLGERSVEVLKSMTVSSKKIREAGFIFQYPEISRIPDL